MDWPVTRAYVEGLGQLYDVPLRFAWRDGGFYRELMRKQWGKRAGKLLETPEGARTILVISGERAAESASRSRYRGGTAAGRRAWLVNVRPTSVARHEGNTSP